MTVHIHTDHDELGHAIPVFWIPLFLELGFLFKKLTDLAFWIGRSSSFPLPSMSCPALKSIQLVFFWARAELVEIFTVGTGPPNGVPRPVVNRTI